MVKCKFEHGGYCCNRGAMQYMDKCEKPCDTIEPISNADRIRSMSDEELVQWVGLDSCPKDAECTLPVNCEKCWLHWLKQPAKDGDNNGNKF